jgi:hypothetical protein
MTWREWFISEEDSAHLPTPYQSIMDHLESVEHVIVTVDTLRQILI